MKQYPRLTEKQKLECLSQLKKDGWVIIEVPMKELSVTGKVRNTFNQEFIAKGEVLVPLRELWFLEQNEELRGGEKCWK